MERPQDRESLKMCFDEFLHPGSVVEVLEDAGGMWVEAKITSVDYLRGCKEVRYCYPISELYLYNPFATEPASATAETARGYIEGRLGYLRSIRPCQNIRNLREGVILDCLDARGIWVIGRVQEVRDSFVRIQYAGITGSVANKESKVWIPNTEKRLRPLDLTQPKGCAVRWGTSEGLLGREVSYRRSSGEWVLALVVDLNDTEMQVKIRERGSTSKDERDKEEAWVDCKGSDIDWVLRKI